MVYWVYFTTCFHQFRTISWMIIMGSQDGVVEELSQSWGIQKCWNVWPIAKSRKFTPQRDATRLKAVSEYISQRRCRPPNSLIVVNNLRSWKRAGSHIVSLQSQFKGVPYFKPLSHTEAGLGTSFPKFPLCFGWSTWSILIHLVILSLHHLRHLRHLQRGHWCW